MGLFESLVGLGNGFLLGQEKRQQHDLQRNALTEQLQKQAWIANHSTPAHFDNLAKYMAGIENLDTGLFKDTRYLNDLMSSYNNLLRPRSYGLRAQQQIPNPSQIPPSLLNTPAPPLAPPISLTPPLPKIPMPTPPFPFLAQEKNPLPEWLKPQRPTTMPPFTPKLGKPYRK